MAEIERREAAFRNNRFTIDSVTHHLATTDSYGKDQIEVLASRRPAEYRTWVMSGPENLNDKIKAVLRIRGNYQGRYANAVTILEAALLSIAAQDDFNADRIWRAYEVVSDPDNPQQLLRRRD